MGDAGIPTRETAPVALRLLLVDDDARFRAVARRALAGEGLEVVGEAGTGRAALRLSAALTPDVVLLDIGLPDVDGREVARRLRTPCGPVVILISSRDEDYGGRVAQGLAHGFIAKSALSSQAVLEMAARP